MYHRTNDNERIDVIIWETNICNIHVRADGLRQLGRRVLVSLPTGNDYEDDDHKVTIGKNYLHNRDSEIHSDAAQILEFRGKK